MMTSKEIVRVYWQAMASNDFYEASERLTEDCEIFMPQTNELIKGRKNFALVNSEYPANGKWQFTINNIVAEGDNVVTDVSVTDGVMQAKVITFHSIKGQLIHRQKEYWPDEYEAPVWRKLYLVNN